MATIRSFRDLRVYRQALRQAKRVYAVTMGLPTEERFSLPDQIRRSSRAVSALLAEGWARRRYPAAFVNKVSEAQGESMETQAWLDHARLLGYIEAEEYRALDAAGNRSAACCSG